MYIGSFLEAVMYIFFDDARFTNCLSSKENNFDFGFAGHGADGVVHGI
jgi:hypothetical protein